MTDLACTRCHTIYRPQAGAGAIICWLLGLVLLVLGVLVTIEVGHSDPFIRCLLIAGALLALGWLLRKRCPGCMSMRHQIPVATPRGQELVRAQRGGASAS